MSTKTTLVLTLGAGFLGGIASQRISLPPVYAQALTPIPTEIRAQSFVIVDSGGKPRGAFAIDPKDGWPNVEISDPHGNAWRTRFNEEGFLRSRKPTLVPDQ